MEEEPIPSLPQDLVFTTMEDYGRWMDHTRSLHSAAAKTDIFDQGGDTSPVGFMMEQFAAIRRANPQFRDLYDQRMNRTQLAVADLLANPARGMISYNTNQG